MSSINKSPTSSLRHAHSASKSRIPLYTSLKHNSPNGIKTIRTTISQATIDRLATPKHVTFCVRTPPKHVPNRLDSAMSWGPGKEHGWNAAVEALGWDVAIEAPIETPDETPIETKQCDSAITNTGATQLADEENEVSYARLRENLFEVLQFATIAGLPIWISLRASQRAAELREEHDRIIDAI